MFRNVVSLIWQIHHIFTSYATSAQLWLGLIWKVVTNVHLIIFSIDGYLLSAFNLSRRQSKKMLKMFVFSNQQAGTQRKQAAHSHIWEAGTRECFFENNNQL